MTPQEAITAWGTSKLPKTARVYVPSKGSTFGSHKEVNITIDPDSVSVHFNYEEGFSCCGGADPTCYCEQATPTRSEITIRGYGTDKDGLQHYVSGDIDIENLDLLQFITELVEIAGSIEPA